MTSYSIESLQHQATELRQQGQNWPDLASTFLKDGVPPETMLQVLLPLVDSYGGRWAIVRAAVLDVPESIDFIVSANRTPPWPCRWRPGKGLPVRV